MSTDSLSLPQLAPFPELAPAAVLPVAPIAPRPVPLTPATGLVLVDELLRDRVRFLDRLESERGIVDVTRTLLLTILACSAAFGAAMGLQHGGIQIVYAAVKLPVVVLLTTAIVAPAFVAMRTVFDAQFRPRRDVALLLGSLSLGSLVLAGTAPVLVLCALAEAGYHDAILATVACAGVAGLVGLHLFGTGVERSGGGSRWMRLIVLGVFIVVGSQLSWALRPYLARPRAAVTFLRPVEGGFFQSVDTTWESANGRFSRDSAPVPSHLRRMP